MTIRGVILSVAAIGAFTAIALPEASPAAAGLAGPARVGCLKMQTLTFTSAQDAAALHHWTPARIKAARGFSQAALRRLGALGVSPRSAAGARPASATQCVPEAALSRSVGPTAPHVTAPGTPGTTASNGYPTIGKLTFNADGVLSPAASSGTLVSVTKTVTVTESGQRYRQASTPGLTDGSSGGPWLGNFNSTTGRGVLFGDTGGYEQGGPSSGSPSYSDYWASAFAAVVKDAVNYEG